MVTPITLPLVTTTESEVSIHEVKLQRNVKFFLGFQHAYDMVLDISMKKTVSILIEYFFSIFAMFSLMGKYLETIDTAICVSEAYEEVFLCFQLLHSRNI